MDLRIAGVGVNAREHLGGIAILAVGNDIAALDDRAWEEPDVGRPGDNVGHDRQAAGVVVGESSAAAQSADIQAEAVKVQRGAAVHRYLGIIC